MKLRLKSTIRFNSSTTRTKSNKTNKATHLLVDQVGGDRVLGRTVPGRENLLAEEEAPGRVPLLGALLLGVLLALADGVHDVVAAAAQRRDLVEEGDVEREAEAVLQADLLAQRVAQLARRRRRVRVPFFRQNCLLE